VALGTNSVLAATWPASFQRLLPLQRALLLVPLRSGILAAAQIPCLDRVVEGGGIAVHVGVSRDRQRDRRLRQRAAVGPLVCPEVVDNGRFLKQKLCSRTGKAWPYAVTETRKQAR
jgi:hypothetical protein